MKQFSKSFSVSAFSNYSALKYEFNIYSEVYKCTCSATVQHFINVHVQQLFSSSATIKNPILVQSIQCLTF